MSVASFTPIPATGNSFIGRQGLVKNLRWRLAQGESLAVIGGPRLGKTSLVRTALQGSSNHLVVEMDLGAEPTPRFDVLPGSIVVLDNLDHAADSELHSLLPQVYAAHPSGMVVTGGRRLHTMLGDSRTLAGRSFRVFPLSVLLDGETRRLVGTDADPSLLTWSGNHPYLTKLLRYHGDDAVTTGRREWEPFVRRLAAEVGEGSERRLLRYLIERGEPVNPAVAQSETGIADIKTVADTLVYLGVISRWIRNEEATLFAGCRLLNDYYMRTRA